MTAMNVAQPSMWHHWLHRGGNEPKRLGFPPNYAQRHLHSTDTASEGSDLSPPNKSQISMIHPSVIVARRVRGYRMLRPESWLLPWCRLQAAVRQSWLQRVARSRKPAVPAAHLVQSARASPRTRTSVRIDSTRNTTRPSLVGSQPAPAAVGVQRHRASINCLCCPPSEKKYAQPSPC